MMAKILFAISALLLITFITLVIIRVRNDQEVNQIWRLCSAHATRSLETVPAENRFTQDMVAGLPAPVQRYFFHAIAPGTPVGSSVSLVMSGSFRLGQDKPWLSMWAKQIISAKGFVWKAAIGRSLFQMRGADYYINGSGRMQFSLWGLLPLVNAHSPDIVRSSIGRLAGELVLLPTALLPNGGVSWKAIDDRTIQASLKIDGEPVTLTLVIDPANGKLLKLSVPRWGDKTEDGSYSYIPFGGEYQEERTFGGFTIPSGMSAGWWFETDRYLEFFRAKIEQAEFR
ncbi:DUF6920 family protein [Iningainema tapete]|uniref:Uncharacterized protein n=1 Tax=Iningainema tapete BLCC-T55 TaxID=2748662 RepID=A0A8J7C880_9CYAN|nr:DUF6544 family protein [Iningainema tapete]MBD2774241.1 hypothetical protein [Iningainema tapete BLCC-T55]